MGRDDPRAGATSTRSGSTPLVGSTPEGLGSTPVWGQPQMPRDDPTGGVGPTNGSTPGHFGVNPARWGRPRPDWGQPRGGAPLKVTYSWCRVVLMRATRVVAGRAQSIREPRRSATARIVATDQANAARLASARASRRFGCARVDATDRVDSGAVGSTRNQG